MKKPLFAILFAACAIFTACNNNIIPTYENYRYYDDSLSNYYPNYKEECTAYFNAHYTNICAYFDSVVFALHNYHPDSVVLGKWCIPAPMPATKEWIYLQDVLIYPTSQHTLVKYEHYKLEYTYYLLPFKYENGKYKILSF